MKFIVAICLALLAACQTPINNPAKHSPDSVIKTNAAPAPPDTTVLGGPWFLQAVLPSDTAAGKTPSLLLDLKKSRFSGNTGCNTMRGEFWFSTNDSSFTFSDKIISTKMACPGYNEPAFMKSLKSTTHYRLRNGTLTLLSDDKTELSRWIRKPSAPSKTLKA
ncbi:MAG TPA: META domain-containing protein [Puia sp.]|jgi:heat shock protein HslJ|nr:META domain-containing protein [Puia sp.]